MALQTRLTVEEFDQLIQRPENADRLFEYIGGEAVELPSNPYASMIGYRIGAAISWFVTDKDLGHVTGEAGGYQVSGERYAPDVAYISKVKQPVLAKSGYNPNPLDLAVEVDFPSTAESREQLLTKIVNYLAAGTVVWRVIPEVQQVRVYAPGEPEKVLRIDDTLDGGYVLPGFTLPLQDIFSE